MTEAERIMQKGFLRKDFFKEEVICDFLVDEKRKKIWAIELDLLREFDRVCKKYNLKYYMWFGSLIGAIRHHGFIPWDDDLDVAMLREDYERFMEVAKDEFKAPYFLQTPYTDEGYYYSYIKLRNSNSTALSKAFQYQPFNQGLFLDIFPLDYTDEAEMEDRYTKVKKLAIQNTQYMKLSNPEITIKNEDKERLLKSDPIVVYEMIQKLAMNHFNVPKPYRALAVWTMSDWHKYLYDADCFENSKECDFEGLKVLVPGRYDNILRIMYGDYMKLPDMEQRVSWHPGAIFEPDIPYKDYLTDM